MYHVDEDATILYLVNAIVGSCMNRNIYHVICKLVITSKRLIL